MTTALNSGTSMAAAHVAGAAAHFMSANPHASPAQVRDALIAGSTSDVSGVPTGTTRRSVYVGDGSETIPAFFHYAVASHGNLKFAGDVVIGAEGTDAVNANVHTNGNLEIEAPTTVVEGFGYHAGDVNDLSLAAEVLQPRYNPSGLAGHQGVEELTLPTFDARYFSDRATKVTGGDLKLSGTVTLGTSDAPVLWYVDGNVRTNGGVKIEGYGVIFARGNADIRHSVSTAESGSMLGLFLNGDVKFSSDDIHVHGMVFSNGNVTIEGRTSLVGSITTGGNVQIKSAFNLTYVPVSPVLTEPFWPVSQ